MTYRVLNKCYRNKKLINKTKNMGNCPAAPQDAERKEGQEEEGGPHPAVVKKQEAKNMVNSIWEKT